RCLCSLLDPPSHLTRWISHELALLLCARRYSSESAELHQPGGWRALCPMQPRLHIRRVDLHLSVDVGFKNLRDTTDAAGHRLPGLLLRVVRGANQRSRFDVREAELLLADLLPAPELLWRYPAVQWDVMLGGAEILSEG